MLKFAFAFLPVFFPVLFTPCNTDQPPESNKAMLSISNDGPYVLYRNNHVIIKQVDDENGFKKVKADSVTLSRKESLELNIRTDEAGKTFAVRLKTRLENEKAEYAIAGKIFVVSDIEGNFRAFRRLLQGNGVIDTAFNWTFGNGHLVLTGDFFDRGSQVTEVLWLIYSLEEKAKAAGGYVHFVLGNHEIMNLNGDLRYVHPKYFENAQLMSETYMTLYSDSSELGRWLRTKNVAEKVGDILFIHAGISSPVNKAQIGVEKINELVRPFYADSSYNFPDSTVGLLYSDLGPFWYRGYYSGNPVAPLTQIDSTLSFYGAKHISTGHTVISDTIRVLHNGKLINTDVHHARGHSEGLLVEGGKYYRVDALGQKFLMLE